MERRVKERLIGACVLVVLVVVVVPELLSGPKPAAPGAAASAADAVRLPADAPDPLRNVTVDLATRRPALAEAAAAVPAVQPAASGDAVNASGPPAIADKSNADSAPVAPANASSASPGPVPPPQPLPTSGQTFALQLGSFANRSNAENLVHQLKAQGFAIYMNTEGSGGGVRYRVRVGPLADQDAAARMMSKLKASGHAATIVSPR